MARESHADSPDPLTQPSSPPTPHRYTRRPVRTASLQPPSRSTPRRASISPSKGSPSKSFIMDTGEREASPWQIRVTVSAEPREGSGSPRKRIKTTRVPIREDETEHEEMGGRRPQRKRKGTPIARRTRSQKLRSESLTDDDGEDVEMAVTDELPPPATLHVQTAGTEAPSQRLATPSVLGPSSPAQHSQTHSHTTRIPSSEITRRMRMRPMRTERYKRLSAAREELDLALRNAVGSEVSDYGEGTPESDAGEYEGFDGGEDGSGAGQGGEGDGGELTVANEDFTMISGESLASIKASTSYLENSHIEHSGLQRSQLEPSGLERSRLGRSLLGKSQLSVSHLPSSPPKSEEERLKEVEYPDLTEAAVEASAREEVAEGDSDVEEMDEEEMDKEMDGVEHVAGEQYVAEQHVVVNQGYDAMSWKPTGPAINYAPPSQVQVEEQQYYSSEVNHDKEARFEEQHRHSSQTNHSHNPCHNDGEGFEEQDAVLGASNPAQPSHQTSTIEGAEEDDDIWAEEASRSLEDSRIEQETARASEQAQKSSTNRLPIFSNDAVPPPRSKIPRTWRRESGVDFLYSDSPARPEEQVAARDEGGEDEGVREAGETDAEGDGESRRSSGVLTPPSTDEDDSSRHLAASTNQAERPDVNGDGQSEPHGEQDDEGASRHDISGFTDVAAADTMLEAHRHAHHRHTSTHSASDSAATSPSSESEDADTGSFFQTHMPALYTRPARRPALKSREQKEYDLSAVLRMDTSKIDTSSSRVDTTVSGGGSPVKTRPAFVGSRRVRERQLERQRQREAEKKGESEVQFSPLLPEGHKLKPQPKQQGGAKAIPSPLRKSLVRSSRSLDGPGDVEKRSLQQRRDQPSSSSNVQVSRTELNTGQESSSRLERVEEVTHVTETQLDDSLASKESDQRQLLQDFKHATPRPRRGADERLAPSNAFEHSQSLQHSCDETQDTTLDRTDLTRSYEENLNIASPQRVKVNFGSSTLEPSHPRPSTHTHTENSQTSPLRLNPRRNYPPLFQKSANVPVLRPTTAWKEGQESAQVSPPSRTLVPQRRTKVTEEQENAGIFSRLSTSFWSAVARPYANTIATSYPSSHPSAGLAGFSADLATSAPHPTTPQNGQVDPTPTSPVKPTLPLSTRAALRNRYGVLPSTHPWTMLHMRTLHRLLNSLTRRSADTIVPTTRLPAHLQALVGTTQFTTTGIEFAFTRELACVVNAFMHLLVSPSIVENMEKGEVEWLGDAQAEHFRGVMGGRRGWDLCFQSEGVRAITPRDGEEVTVEWVVGGAGCCVLANLAEDDAAQAQTQVQPHAQPQPQSYSKPQRNGKAKATHGLDLELGGDGIVGGKGAEIVGKVVEGSLMGDSDLMGSERVGMWFGAGREEGSVGQRGRHTGEELKRWADIGRERGRVWPT